MKKPQPSFWRRPSSLCEQSDRKDPGLQSRSAAAMRLRCLLSAVVPLTQPVPHASRYDS
jgi:hypothetical protein